MTDHGKAITALQEHAHSLAREIETLKKRLQNTESEIGSLHGAIADLKKLVAGLTTSRG